MRKNFGNSRREKREENQKIALSRAKKTNQSDPYSNSNLGQTQTHNPLPIHWFSPTHAHDPIIIANPTQRLPPNSTAQHPRSHVCLSNPQCLQPKTWQSMAKPNYLRPTCNSPTPMPRPNNRHLTCASTQFSLHTRWRLIAPRVNYQQKEPLGFIALLGCAYSLGLKRSVWKI